MDDDSSPDYGYDYGSMYAPGSGTYDVGQGPQFISAPGDNAGGFQTLSGDSGRSMGYSDSPSASYRANFSDPQFGEMASWNSGGGGIGRPYGGGGGYTQPPMQRIQLGSPERTLYDRYAGLLKDPSSMGQDPAYQFLFNQGTQALNRSLAARGQAFSGRALTEQQQFGSGLAYDYMNKMLPQYQAGAQTELSRFMGPASLQPQYTSLNNAATTAEGGAAASQQLIPYYQRYLSQGGGGGGYGGYGGGYGPPPVPSGPSFGGVGGGYTPRMASSYGDPYSYGMG